MVTYTSDTSDLQALIAALDDIIFELDGKKTLLNVWVRDERLLFLPKEDFLGKSVSEVMEPLAECMNGLLDQLIQTKEPQKVIYPHINPDKKQYFKAKMVIARDADDLNDVRIALTVSDVTEQQLQKKELERVNAIFNASQLLSKTGGWEFKLNTGEVLWTAQTYNIFDMRGDEVITYDIVKSHYTEDSLKKLEGYVEEAIATGKGYMDVLRTNNGKWVRVIGEAVYNEDKVVKLRGAIMDVTDKINSRMELVAAKEAAEEAARAKTRFLSIMSHEIRTPLNGIIGTANLLGLNKMPEQEELIDSLIFSSNHLLGLVNDILDLNKIESDKLELVHKPLQLSSLVTNIKHQFTSMAEDKGLRLITDIDTAIPNYILADEVRMGQVINNLVNNAIKFTDNGSVAIRLALVNNADNKATIKFSVSDTGIGIPKEHHDSIFETFRQVQQAETRKHAGTGLGLAITKRLVELQGGNIQIKSAQGEGTVFFFELTFDVPEEQNISHARLTESDILQYKERFTGLKLLLAEDNPVNTLVARKQLESFGITPDCVTNGVEALEKLKLQDYDIALIDLHMPEMDGFQLSAMIRKSFPDVHIIVFTADIMAEARERLAKLNVYDILTKPFKPQEMLAILLKVTAG